MIRNSKITNYTRSICLFVSMIKLNQILNFDKHSSMFIHKKSTLKNNKCIKIFVD